MIKSKTDHSGENAPMERAGGRACPGVIRYRLGAGGNCRLYDPGKLPKDSAQAPQRQGVQASRCHPGSWSASWNCCLGASPTAGKQHKSRENETPTAGGPRGVSRAGSTLSPCPPRSLPPRGPRPSSGACGGVRSPEHPAPRRPAAASTSGAHRPEGLAGERGWWARVRAQGRFPKLSLRGRLCRARRA